MPGFEGELQIGTSLDFTEQPERVTLPEGDYDAVVIGCEIKRYTPGPGAKLTACNMAKVTLEIQAEAGTSRFTETLFLHTKCLGMLSAFFKSVELVDAAGKFNLDFNPAIGRHCMVHVRVDTFQTKNGTGTGNKVARWLPPPEPGFSLVGNAQVQGVYTSTGTQYAPPVTQYQAPATQYQPPATPGSPAGWGGGAFH